MVGIWVFILLSFKLYMYALFCMYDMFHNNNFKALTLLLCFFPPKGYFPHSPHLPEFWLKGKGDALESEEAGTLGLHAHTKEM